MVQPYNYSIGQANPANAFMGGLQQGAAIEQFRIDREEQAREQAIKKQQYEQAQQLQSALTNLATNPNPSVREITAIADLLPKDQADSLRSSFELQENTQQRATLRFGGQVLAALQTQNPELAVNMLRSRITAENDRGNAQGAQFYQGVLNVVETDPTAARDSVAIMLAALPGGKDFLQVAMSVSEEARKRLLAPQELAKLQADLGLTEAQTLKALSEAEAKSAELQKTTLELEAMRQGKLPIEQKFNKEIDLNKQYYSRTEGLRDSRRNFETIKSSAADSTGAGDIALVTSFMKMLDPGSVVRETEFATARDTVGLLDKLANQAQQIETGKFLSPTQRQEFVGLANKYLAAAEQEGLAARKSIEALVNNYDLNPENVFGPPPESTPPTEPPVPTTPPPPPKSDVRREADEIIRKG